ncbi:hypothetical protein [Candidatus Darwinibacter acetoxidans]
MSKGRGKKIVIKFTESLLGDVSGNESAFTVTGMEKDPLFYGTLQQREYTVESVERRPIQTLHEEDFEGGTFDDTEKTEEGLRLESSEVPGDEVEDTYDTSNATGSSYTTIANRVTSKESGTLTKVKAKTKTAGDYTLNIKSDNGETTYRTETINDAPADSWITFEGFDSLGVAENDEYRVEIARPSGVAYAASGLYDGTLWENREGLFGASGFSWTNAMGFIFQETAEKYPTPGTYTSPAIPTATLPADPRLRFEANTPEDTTVTVEYACTDDDETPPETWMSVDDEDLLTIDDAYLWLRYTLETEDTSKTPTLLAVWLEEAEVPPDKILLTMTEAGRFNNVEGDLTVAYNQNVGNLSGLRPVESFEESFTPEDLEPSPVDEHIITVRGEPVVGFINVTYEPGYEAHTVTVTGTGVLVDFIHVDDIPP